MSNSRATRDHLLGEQLASHEFDKDIVGKPLNIRDIKIYPDFCGVNPGDLDQR